MSHALITHMRQLAKQHDWTGLLALESDTYSLTEPKDRAWGLHLLGCAHWNLSRDAFDLSQAVRYARAAVKLDFLGGRVPKVLGIRLVTLGKYTEGRRILQDWLSHFTMWEPEAQADLPHVQYSLGYAARYEGHFRQAQLWYATALAEFSQAGNTEWTILTSCALVQVEARMGLIDQAKAVFATIPEGTEHEGYRLKAMTELLAAMARRHEDFDISEALAAGEAASSALFAHNDDDPWELAELHLLLADLQFQAGNYAEKEVHLALAMDVFRLSPRQDLYKAACLLLDHDGKEVPA